jgi:hypothetical protein
MKILLSIVIVLVSIIFSGCAVPTIVKNITGEVQKGKEIHLKQKKTIIQSQFY